MTRQRNTILKANQAIRSGNTPLPRKMDWGYVGFRIPENDFKVLQVLFPGLASRDADELEQAWHDFNEHELSNLYRVTERSPNQVRRRVRHGNSGILV